MRVQLLKILNCALHPKVYMVGETKKNFLEGFIIVRTKLIRRRRIRLKRDNHRKPIPPQPTVWILIYILPASGRGFAFAKQDNKMRRLRRRTREGGGGMGEWVGRERG